MQCRRACAEVAEVVENLWNACFTAECLGFGAEWCGNLLFHVEHLELRDRDLDEQVLATRKARSVPRGTFLCSEELRERNHFHGITGGFDSSAQSDAGGAGGSRRR
jgi:hypothetical protein